MDYAGIIFDCDGTLADTMGTHFVAWTQVMERHGLPFDEDVFFRTAGMPPARIVAQILDELGDGQSRSVDIDAICAERDAAFLAEIGRIGPVEPVVTIAREHRGVIPMAVASGSGRASVTRTLDTLGIRGWFDALLGSEDTERHKPAPDVFLEAARRLGVPPNRCCVYEDADLGLEAARRAGMAAIDVRPMYEPRWFAPRTEPSA